jgi:hypothetical protein
VVAEGGVIPSPKAIRNPRRLRTWIVKRMINAITGETIKRPQYESIAAEPDG